MKNQLVLATLGHFHNSMECPVLILEMRLQRLTGLERDKIEKILLSLNLDLNLRPGNLTLKNCEQIHCSIHNEN